MGRKQRRKRQSKKVYLFIVGGSTEENYINLLKRTYRKDAKVNNCEGGNARGVLKEARKLVVKHRDDYSGYVVWFDSDRYFPSLDSNLKNCLESKNNVEVYMSEPCVENWLLAHFQPITTKHADYSFYEKALQKYIPNYRKSDSLDRYIDKAKIQTAIINYPEIGEIPRKYFA